MIAGPWRDTLEGAMWSYPKGHGRWPLKPGIRNDALWSAKRQERLGFVALCREWKRAAEADGWLFAPTYGDHESVDRAFRGFREGFTIQGIARDGDDKMLPSATIHIWGPDSLAVEPPLTYDMNEIRRRVRSCGYCDATDVDTVRVGFAGRVCADCDPKVRPSIERPGWTN